MSFGLKRWLLLLVGGLLALDAAYLMSLGLFNFGVLLPLALGIGSLLLAWHWPAWQARLNASSRLRRGWIWLQRGLIVWLVSVGLFFALLWSFTRAQEPALSGAQAIVVLGSGTPHGTPSPTLKARLDAGALWADRFRAAQVVVSGGTDFAESRAEAQIMGDYLREKGLAASRILQEEQSTSTEENLRLSRALLQQHAIPASAPILLVTSDFHTLRTRMIARRAGFEHVTMVSAATPLYLRYNAWLREYFAFISSGLLREY